MISSLSLREKISMDGRKLIYVNTTVCEIMQAVIGDL